MKQAPLLSVFVGGCLSGAALLSLWENADTHQASQRHAPVAVPPSNPSDQRQPDETRVAPEKRARAHRVLLAPRREPDDEQQRDDESRSAGEVLAYLEARYQAEFAAETQGAVEPTPGDVEAEASDPAPAEPAEISETATLERAPLAEADAPPALVDNEVAVVLNQTDTHESAAHHGDVVSGDKVLGSKVLGDVHVGDVNHVEQVALVYQPVFVLPAEAKRAAPAARARVAAKPLPPIDPFGPLTLSADHDPWKTSLGDPKGPFSSEGPLPR